MPTKDIQEAIKKGQEFLEALTYDWDDLESEEYKEMLQVAFKIHQEMDDTAHPDTWDDPLPEPTHQNIPEWLMALVTDAPKYDLILSADDPRNGFIGFTLFDHYSDGQEKEALWMTVKISEVKGWMEATSMTDDPVWVKGIHATLNRLGTVKQVIKWLKSLEGRQKMAKKLQDME